MPTPHTTPHTTPHITPTSHANNSHSSVPHNYHHMNGNVSSRGVNVWRYGGSAPIQVSPIIGSPSKQPLLDVWSGHQSSQLDRPSTQAVQSLAITQPSPPSNVNTSPKLNICGQINNGIREMLASLALMCLLSLLMAFLALFFLQRTCPMMSLPDDPNDESNEKVNKNVNSVNHMRIVANPKEFVRVFQISISLSTLTISLDLCCLFVCCIQFLSAVKLLKTPFGNKRAHEFLKRTSHVRVAAIGAFLISIPIFFTGVILFTFINFDEVTALCTSVAIAVGIIFCGISSVQSVYLWQWEKTKASQEMSESRYNQLRDSSYLPTIELSTLV